MDKKNIMSKTEELLQQILDKLDDIYIVEEARLEVEEEAYNLSIGKVKLLDILKSGA